MCGIVGYIGKENTSKILLDGLKELEYRGYDSAGISILENDKFELFKAVGKIKTEYYSGTGNITSSTLSSADKVLNEYMRPYIRSTLRVVL